MPLDAERRRVVETPFAWLRTEVRGAQARTASGRARVVPDERVLRRRRVTMVGAGLGQLLSVPLQTQKLGLKRLPEPTTGGAESLSGCSCPLPWEIRAGT